MYIPGVDSFLQRSTLQPHVPLGWPIQTRYDVLFTLSTPTEKSGFKNMMKGGKEEERIKMGNFEITSKAEGKQFFLSKQ